MTNHCNKKRCRPHYNLRKGDTHVRRSDHPPLFSYPCRDQDREPVFLYLPLHDLTDHQARELLLHYGYMPENPNACVMHLIRRLHSTEEFPHEIGLFLSYPPKDVLGFILNRACNHKCQGCWKVYGDEQESKSIFEKYDLCSRIYSEQWKQGKSIEQLTVAG